LTLARDTFHHARPVDRPLTDHNKRRQPAGSSIPKGAPGDGGTGMTKRNDDRTRIGLPPAAALSRRGFIEASGAAAAAGAAFLLATTALRAQTGPLKIGSMGPFTGPASRTGDEFKNGVALALEDARAEGDLPLTIDGEQRDIEIVYIDSQSSPEKAVKAVTDAITREGVQFICNGWHSSVAMAVTDAEAPFKIVHIGHLGESQYISEKMAADPEKYRGWFKGWPAPPKLAGLYGPPLQHFIESGAWQPRNKKAAILVEDTDFGRGWGDAIIESLGKAGFEVLPYDVTSLEETEFTPLLTKYKAQQVALVGMTSTGNVSASNFVKQFHQQKVPALLIAHGLGWFSEWYELTGEASNYALAIDSPQVIADFQRDWVKRYKDKFGIDPGIAASGITYDYMRMALKVLNKAGTLDFDTLVQTIYDTPNKGVWNVYRFPREPNDNALAPNEVMTGEFMQGFFFPMVQLMDGQAKVIWPLDYAAAEFQAPPWLKT
jgi:branched-chain amino acid transport system substrate-binding protein